MNDINWVQAGTGWIRLDSIVRLWKNPHISYFKIHLVSGEGVEVSKEEYETIMKRLNIY